MTKHQIIKYVTPRAQIIMDRSDAGCAIAKELIHAYELVRELPTSNIVLDARLEMAVYSYGEKYDDT